ncbi:hypothetical protein LTR27_011209 [Elasticomyces elasticus]|nr:hypothetical protein LTR27_011209 [Elasticomyces elasticus]
MASSSLFKLSAELRNCIYELALNQHQPINISAKTYHPSVDKVVLTCTSAIPWPTALIMTCKEISDETAQMYYANQTFVFSCTNINVTGAFATQVAVAEAFLHQIGPHNRLGLRSIRFEASTLHSFEYSLLKSPFAKLSAFAKQNPQIKDFKCAVKIAMIEQRPNDVLEVVIDVCDLIKSIRKEGKVLKAREDDAAAPANSEEAWKNLHTGLVGCALVLVATDCERYDLREQLRKLGKLGAEDEDKDE